MSEAAEIKHPHTLSICIQTEAPFENHCFEFTPILELADEILIAKHHGNPRFFADLPSDRCRVIDVERAKTQHEIWNHLNRNARSDWILFLTSCEGISPKDTSRIAHLLRHPLGPCYEVPTRHYLRNSLRGTQPCTGEYPEQEDGYGFFLETTSLRLIPHHSGAMFDSSPATVTFSSETHLRAKPIRCNVPIHHWAAAQETYSTCSRNHIIIRLEEAWLTQKPNHPTLYQDIGTAYLKIGDLNRARDYFEKAVSLRPDYPPFLNTLGYIHMELQQLEKAKQLFERIIQIEPDYEHAHSNLGVTFMRLRQFETAAVHLRNAIALKADEPSYHYNLGNTLFRCGKIAESMAAYRRALSYQSNYPSAMAELAGILIDRGDIQEAEDLLSRSLAADPTHPQTLFNLGILYCKANKKRLAITYWTTFMEHHRESELARHVQQLLANLRKELRQEGDPPL